MSNMSSEVEEGEHGYEKVVLDDLGMYALCNAVRGCISEDRSRISEV